MDTPRKHHWVRTLLLFGAFYLLVGVAFPNPSSANANQFLWRLGAWLICAFAFVVHIGIEHFRFRHSSLAAALHVCMSVAVAAFGLAVAANIHALRNVTGTHRLLALALVLWPVLTGVPAFLVALIGGAGLSVMRR